jgi:hypothetical protein
MCSASRTGTPDARSPARNAVRRTIASLHAQRTRCTHLRSSLIGSHRRRTGYAADERCFSSAGAARAVCWWLGPEPVDSPRAHQPQHPACKGNPSSARDARALPSRAGLAVRGTARITWRSLPRGRTTSEQGHEPEVLGVVSASQECASILFRRAGGGAATRALGRSDRAPERRKRNLRRAEALRQKA